MFRRCALRLRQCIQFARKRGVLSRRSAAGSGSLVARHRQVHAPCEAEIGNGHKLRSAKHADRHGVLGYKGARRTRLIHRNASKGRRGCEPPGAPRVGHRSAKRRAVRCCFAVNKSQFQKQQGWASPERTNLVNASQIFFVEFTDSGLNPFGISGRDDSDSIT